MGVGVCYGNWQLLLCVGECKDYFGVNFLCVGITNTWPLPRIAKTHTANERVLSINALFSVCFFAGALTGNGATEMTYVTSLFPIPKRLLSNRREQNNTCPGRSWQVHMMGR